MTGDLTSDALAYPCQTQLAVPQRHGMTLGHIGINV